MAASKLDLCTDYSLSRVESQDLEVAIVVAWLITSRRHRLPCSKCTFQVLELLHHVRQQVGMTNRLMWVWSIMYRPLSVPKI